MQNRILITGSSGFTGKNLVLLNEGEKGTSIFLSDRTEPAIKDGRFYKCDFLDETAVKSLIDELRPGEIYHTVGTYTNNYAVDYAANVTTAINLLSAIAGSGVKARVLLLGSAAEYGVPDDPERGVKESDPLRPVSIYGLTKVFQTALMDYYVRIFGLDIVMARTFNLLGEAISPLLINGSVQRQISTYKNGETDKIVTGNLSQERDFIEIKAAVEYYQAIMKKGKTGEIYNVGSGRSVKLREVVSNIVKEAGLGMDIVEEAGHNTPGKISVPKIFADVSKLKKIA